MSNGQNPVTEKRVFFTKRRKTFFAIAILGLIAVIVFFNQPFGANISRQQAVELAIQHIGGGTANRPDIDWERFQRAWYVEVFYGSLVHSVYVSTRTGEVIRVEVDRWD